MKIPEIISRGDMEKEERILALEVECLLKYVSKKPIPINKGRLREMTEELKRILREFKCGTTYETLMSRRGFKPSERLLKYSQEAFGKEVEGIVAMVGTMCGLSSFEELLLKKEILLAVARVVWGSEKAKELEELCRRVASTTR